MAFDPLKEGATKIFDPVAEGATALAEPQHRDFMAEVLFSDRPVEQWLPLDQAELAGSIFDSLENPEEGRSQLANNFLLSELFNIPEDSLAGLQPAMIKELYGDELKSLSASVVNKKLKEDTINALKELPENLWIGTIGMTAGALEAIKLNAVQLAGGGALPDDAVLRQFEAVTPALVPGPDSIKNPADANNFIYREDVFDFLRPERPLPGAITAEAFGILTRLPDIGARIIRGKQSKLVAAQSIATLDNAPITKLSRSVVQGGVPSMGVAVGVSLLTGNPLIGLVMLGQTEGGAAFQRQLNEGGSVQKAIIIGRLSEATEIGTELLVLPNIVKGLKEGLTIRKGLTLVAENAGQEAIAGFNQTFLEVFGIETTKGTDNTLAAKKAFVAGVEAVPESAFVGGATGGLAGTVGVSVDVGRGLATATQARKAVNDIIKQVKVDIATEEVEEAGIAAPVAEAAEAVVAEAEGVVEEVGVAEGLEAKQEAVEGLPELNKADFPDDAVIETEQLKAREAGTGPFALPFQPATQRISIKSDNFTVDQRRKLTDLGFVKMPRENRYVSPDILAQPTPTEQVDEEIPEIPEAKRIISQEAFEAARARIINKGVLRTGINPRDFVDLATVGAFHFETGVRKFAEWSKVMIDEFGNKVKPHLQRIWNDVTGAPVVKEGDDFGDFLDFLEEGEPEAAKTLPKAKALSEIKKDVADEVLADEIFQVETEAAEIRKRQIDVGVFFVPTKFKGEVKIAIENDPSLRFNITFDKKKGILFDIAVQAGFLQRSGDAFDTHLDISEFLDRVTEAKRSARLLGGIPEAVLNKMVNSGNPVSEIVATKHIMLSEGSSIAEVNKEVRKIVKGSSLDVEQFLLKQERGIVGLTRAEAKAAGEEATEELRQAQAEGEKVGFKAGERASREKAKVAVQKLKQAQKLTEQRRKTALELVKAFVPKEDQGKFTKRVAEAKTPRDLEKLTEAVDKGVERAEKREAISDMKKAAKAIKPAKMLPEFAQTARNILDSIQLGKIRPETEIKLADMKAMAQQVLDTAREDSVAAFQAQQLLTEMQSKTAKTFAINQLSVEAIEQITDTLVALRFQNEADTIAAKDENAKEAIRRRKLIKEQITTPPKIADNIGGQAVKKFKFAHDNLESISDSVSGARPGTFVLWRKSKRAITEFIYDVFDRGVDNQANHSEAARDIFRGVLADNNVSSKDILNWSMRPDEISIVQKAFDFGPKPIVHKFTLEDFSGKATEFEFTVNEVMSIFMHTRNSHNLAVLLNDGMVRTIKGKEQEIKGFTVEVIDDMIDSLTAQQKNVARQVGSKLMDNFNRDAINETSAKLEFFELAKVDNYWPARRFIIRGPKGKKLAGSNILVESMGLLKERTGIGNPMKLSGFFETAFNSSNSVAKYVGLAEPLREVKAVYTPEVILDMKRKGRAEEARRVNLFIERIEGQLVEQDELGEIVSRMIGGFARSKLFLNAKIAPRQQISEFLISAYVNPKYMAEFRGVADNKTLQEVRELSPQMRARFDSLQFDRDVGDAFARNSLMNYLTNETSLIDKTALGMKFFDTNAIVDIYRATKAEVIDNGIDITTDEGRALLKDRFEWVVRHTQPVWNVKDRSLLGSSLNPVTRALTMFMSQREQLVRMINNGIIDFANSDKTSGDQLRLGRTLGSVAMNLVAFTAYNLAWAALIQRRPRDVKDFMRNVIKDILSLPFFGKYLSETFGIIFNSFADKPNFHQDSFQDAPVEGILKDILLDGVANFANAGRHFVTGETYQSGRNKGEEKWKIELLVAIDSMAGAIAALKGIPYYGAKDIVRTVEAQIKAAEKQPSKKIQR